MNQHGSSIVHSERLRELAKRMSYRELYNSTREYEKIIRDNSFSTIDRMMLVIYLKLIENEMRWH